MWWLGLWKPSSVGMVNTFIIAICGFISNLLRAVWRTLVSEPAGLAVPHKERGLSFREFMEELSPRQLAVKQLKQQFLEALQANNAQEVMEILHTGKLDIDTVLEVDDPSMALASYKQGEVEEIDPQQNNIPYWMFVILYEVFRPGKMSYHMTPAGLGEIICSQKAFLGMMMEQELK